MSHELLDALLYERSLWRDGNFDTLRLEKALRRPRMTVSSRQNCSPQQECAYPGSGAHEDFNRLLKRCAKHGPGLGLVDAVSRDGHDVSPVGHTVCQAGDVAVVDIGADKGEHGAQLVEEGASCAFNAEDGEHFEHVVAARLLEADLWVHHDLGQVGPVRLEKPFAFGLESALLLSVPAAHILAAARFL